MAFANTMAIEMSLNCIRVKWFLFDTEWNRFMVVWRAKRDSRKKAVINWPWL